MDIIVSGNAKRCSHCFKYIPYDWKLIECPDCEHMICPYCKQCYCGIAKREERLLKAWANDEI